MLMLSIFSHVGECDRGNGRRLDLNREPLA
jgi:hypothetical protein